MEAIRNYWGYRICTDHISYFQKELSLGRLHQGWGYHEGQDLRNMTYDGGAWKNRRMLDVKKGDYLLIPRLPDWDSVSIVEAIEDWSTGYSFEIDKKLKDFGHIFPAKILCVFNRHSEVVSGNIRSTLKNPGRFWNINYLTDDIEKIINSKGDGEKLKKYHGEKARLYGTIESCYRQVFNSDHFAETLSREMHRQFQASEWENALVCGLRELYPEPFFTVERTGGRTEVQHGTDVIIKFSNPLSEFNYIIAIQIKDYQGQVWNVDDIVKQIHKAKSWDQGNDKLLESVLIVTRSEKEYNTALDKACKENNITLIMGKQLDSILMQIGLKRIANNFPYSED